MITLFISSIDIALIFIWSRNRLAKNTVYTHLIYEEFGYIYMPRDIADIRT
jgi:hypothetical protein